MRPGRSPGYLTIHISIGSAAATLESLLSQNSGYTALPWIKNRQRVGDLNGRRVPHEAPEVKRPSRLLRQPSDARQLVMQ